jgi:hypothetical protein
VYYQISYPRSGANWLRYIARTILEIQKEYHERDDSNDLYIKTHVKNDMVTLDKSGSLILLLRDFKNCIYSHTKSKEPPVLQLYFYRDLLDIYHTWPANKILIYYADLVQKPETVIPKFSWFISQSYDNGKSFLENYDSHQLHSIIQYKGKKDLSSIDDPYRHAKKINVKRWDTAMLNICQENLRQYIERFLS